MRQSMDLRNPWIVLRKVAIYTLRNKVRGFVAHSMDSPAVMRKLWICAIHAWIILRQV